MKILNFLMPYRCDYKELKKYKKQFDSYNEVDKLREIIINDLSKISIDNLLDLELKLKIEIEEIKDSSRSSSFIPLIAFMLGVLAEPVKKDRRCFIIFMFGIMLVAILYASYISRSSKYYKYYIFYNEMIKRYKKDNYIN